MEAAAIPQLNYYICHTYLTSMKLKWSGKVVALVLVVAALAGFGIYKLALVSSARDRVKELLHLNNEDKVAVKGDSQKINNKELLQKYYDAFGYDGMWTDPSMANIKFRHMLVMMLNYADSLGLDPKDYHADYVAKYDSLAKTPGFDFEQYKEESELIFTDAALSFLYNVAYGKEIKTEFNGVSYNIDSARILNVYNELLTHGNWRKTLTSIEPPIEQYRIMKTRLNDMRGFLKSYPGADTLKASNSNVMAAAVKLRFYGIVADSLVNDTTAAAQLRPYLVTFQRMMGLDTTGKLDAKTLSALNFALPTRMAQVKESLNYWRWTGRLKEREFILVNIPAARLQVINHDSAVDMSMRVIVGKTTTQTPSFTAYITRVIAYPYWTAPYSITSKEMLPKIKKDVRYLENNNMQVLDKNGNVLDPTKINWSQYTAKNFPFTIRQGTGCDNSLGVLKFDLNSPFSIYLHDTNRRDLFGNKNRFMSHGCIRVEKPLELANYVLDNGLDSITNAQLQQCLKDQKPKSFPLSNKFPVLILYMTADVDAAGVLRFYNDVYDKEDDLEIEKVI